MYVRTDSTCPQSEQDCSSTKSKEIPQVLIWSIVYPDLGFYKGIVEWKDRVPVLAQDFRQTDMPTTDAINCLEQSLLPTLDNG